jgi:hypothetical protein
MNTNSIKASSAPVHLSAEETVQARYDEEKRLNQKCLSRSLLKYERELIAEAQRRLRLNQSITREVPRALARLAKKQWKNGELRNVNTWDGQMTTRKWIWNDSLLFPVRLTLPVIEQKRLVSWNIYGAKLFLLSDGRFAIRGYYDDLYCRFEVSRYNHGTEADLWSTEAGQEAKNYLSEQQDGATLQAILKALKAL